MLLSDFQIIRPPFESNQEDTLNWLIETHVAAEKQLSNADPESFRKDLTEKLWRVGCKPDRIAKRGHISKDSLHKEWSEMEIYRLDKSPFGENLTSRANYFESFVDRVFSEYYPPFSSPPDDLIHVSCTGYVSPSGAQKIASTRNWGHQTTVTHAYHMGCYASIPAIRMAKGFLASDPDKKRIDIVHTEVCSLHANPSNHSADQLVSQSLFADGFIKYSASQASGIPHLKVLAVHEEIIPSSLSTMTWKMAHWGFEMKLAKEIPVLIARALPLFLINLGRKISLPIEELTEKAIFAVHPGGPKILSHAQELLKLKEAQMAHSFDILRNFGNMSSATLPHIWQSVLNDKNVSDRSLIASLAFGPGLSITGAIMEKRV